MHARFSKERNVCPVQDSLKKDRKPPSFKKCKCWLQLLFSVSVLVLEITAVETSAFAHKQCPKTAFNSIRCIPFNLEIVQIYEGKTSISKNKTKQKKTYCKKLLHSHKVLFWVIGTRHTLQNSNENTLFTLLVT